MSGAQKQRPGVANEHEIRLNLRLMRGRDGTLFKVVHDLVAHLGPRQRVEALRLWMLEAATSGSSASQFRPVAPAAALVAPTPSKPKGSSNGVHSTGDVNIEKLSQADGSVAVGQLDMTQLIGVDMDVDF